MTFVIGMELFLSWSFYLVLLRKPSKRYRLFQAGNLDDAIIMCHPFRRGFDL
jgi:hypothetical protein